MTAFERFLINIGYLKYTLDIKNDMRYHIAKGHILSTMVNLDHRYIHKSNINFIGKINAGKSVMDEDFTDEDRKGEICFGLHERNKPPTLIYPRPDIEIKRKIKNEATGIEEIIIYDQIYDDSMNVVLECIPPEQILIGMYDKNIILKIDLTNQ